MKQSIIYEVFEPYSINDEESLPLFNDNHHLIEREETTYQNHPELIELRDDEPSIWKTKCPIDSDMISGYFYDLVHGWPGEQYPQTDNDNDNFIFDENKSLVLSLKGMVNMAELISGRDRLIYSIDEKDILLVAIRMMRPHIEELNFDDHHDRDIFFGMIKALDYFPQED